MEDISIEKTKNLGLPLLIPNQAQKEITHNEALIILDNLIQNTVITKNLNIPPQEPKTNDLYIVGENASDVWLNKDFQLAFYDNGWRFIEPKEGITFWVKDEDCQYTYDGENWIITDEISNKKINLIELNDVKVNNIKNGEFLRFNGNKFINTKSLDNVENLSTNILNINKSEETATASCILQDNSINKIEFGLIQSDNFTLKVSNNGENWKDSFVVDIESGNVDFKSNVSVNGNSFVNIETYTDENGNWYRRYSDGWIEQGGKLPNTSGANILFNFLIPFKDTNYFIVKNCGSNSGDNPAYRSVSCYNKTTTTVMHTSNTSQVYAAWFACGYYK